MGDVAGGPTDVQAVLHDCLPGLHVAGGPHGDGEPHGSPMLQEIALENLVVSFLRCRFRDVAVEAERTVPRHSDPSRRTEVLGQTVDVPAGLHLGLDHDLEWVPGPNAGLAVTDPRTAREEANAEAFRRMTESEPVLEDIRPAIDVLPGMTANMVLTSGPGC